MIGNVQYLTKGSVVTTYGLSGSDLMEISVDGTNVKLSDKESLLRYVVNYLVYTNKTIEPGETITYGSWLLKFQTAKINNLLEIWELTPSEDKQIFRPGATFALELWDQQTKLCKKYLTKFEPPQSDMLVAISKGVYEGELVEGVRYEISDNMSGWFITTDQYDDNIKSMRVEHIGHLVSKRPDLGKYLALPPGFRFHTYNQGDSIRFDSLVANQPV